MTLVHGGQLQKIAKQYNISLSGWLDLSTGIAPLSYPVPDIPLALWQQLPQKSTGLISAAKHYYQCQDILVTNGSQAIIKSLPALWQQHNPLAKKVYLPERGYQEHQQAWQKAGYQLCFYQQALPEIDRLAKNSVLVVINPNNPSGCHFPKTELRAYQDRLKKLDGLLVVDEAFIDVFEPEHAMASLVENSHTLVLRSFGKFFGLAGIRIGFLVASPYWRDVFSAHLGPWQVNGPAQFIAEQALADQPWQQQQRATLAKLRNAQETLLWQVLGQDIIADIKGTDLFLTVSFCQAANKDHQQTNLAKIFYHQLCLQGIYVRLSDEEDKLRFGIALSEHLPRLAQALSKIKQSRA
ncbi:MAG: threonine-phosphate decarboxylase CobD [Thalassotalea sp.]